MSQRKMSERIKMARLWYKGTHTHPVQRAGVVIPEKTNREVITMRVLEDGRTKYDWEEAPIRSFRRDRIATFASLRREVRARMKLNYRQLGRPMLTIRSV